MSLETFFLWTRDIQKKKIFGTILTTRIHAVPLLGIGLKSSSDKREVVKCEISSYHSHNDNFGYKIKAVPYTEELQLMYGAGETYYTSDFSSLMEADIGFSIEGYTPQLKSEMRSICSRFRDGTLTTNEFEEGSLEHFYLNELIKDKREDDEYEARVAEANKGRTESPEDYDWY